MTAAKKISVVRAERARGNRRGVNEAGTETRRVWRSRRVSETGVKQTTEGRRGIERDGEVTLPLAWTSAENKEGRGGARGTELGEESGCRSSPGDRGSPLRTE